MLLPSKLLLPSPSPSLLWLHFSCCCSADTKRELERAQGKQSGRRRQHMRGVEFEMQVETNNRMKPNNKVSPSQDFLRHSFVRNKDDADDEDRNHHHRLPLTPLFLPLSFLQPFVVTHLQRTLPFALFRLNSRCHNLRYWRKRRSLGCSLKPAASF